jgi:frataxin-like iron-binding protein CyaY
MKSFNIIKSKSPKSNISNMGSGRAKNYLNKNLHKKYIYKKEKAIDTDKVLQNNKISKNLVFSPTIKKGNNGIKYKNFLNNSNNDLRRDIEIRDDVNIDYEQYQQQINNVSISNYNPIINNSNMMNQSFFVMSKKNGYLTSSNRDNKWKCTKCGNVNSNFNLLCNNCNMPNNSLDQNSSIIVNKRSGSTGKNIETIGLGNNLINSSFNNSFNNNSFNNNSFNNNSFNNNINNSSQNLLSKSINNNVIKKQFLRKNNNNNLKTLRSEERR